MITTFGDWVAVYAAILSTVIAIWEFVKWKARISLSLEIRSNMLTIGNVGFFTDPKQKFIIADVVNRGEVATTVTHYLGYYWKNWFSKLTKPAEQAFIIDAQGIPKMLQPGENGLFMAAQTAEIEQLSRDGILMMGIAHTMGKKEMLRRVVIKMDSPVIKKI